EARDLEGLARVVAREATLGLAPDPLVRLAALLPADARLLDAVGARLRLSNAQRKRLAAMGERLAGPPDSPLGRPHAVAELAWWRGAQGARDALLLGPAEPLAEDIALLDGWVRPRLPVGGADLVAAGVPPGPQVARRLAALERAWVAGGFRASAQELLEQPQEPG
ncbi:MAG: hypothetical protein ACK40H_09535, partial [Sphingomonadaceae bacterium]